MDAKNNVTSYSHDDQGNLTAITYANNTIEHWEYDSTGNPTTWTNRRGNTIQYEFNSNGQLMAKLYPDGTRADYAYDARGNLIAAENSTGRITLEYDASDRLQRITYPDNRWLEYTYNAAEQRASMTDQLGYRLDYEYDAVGRLQSVTNSAGIPLVLYEYDAAGRLARKTLGNGVYTTYTYDSAGQLLTLTNVKPDNSVLSFFKYTYDSRGRRISMATHYGTWTYEYDDLSQLTHAVLTSTDPQIPSQDLRYEYDVMGNRVRTVEDGGVTEYTVNNVNEYAYVGRTSYQFDPDGNLLVETGQDSQTTNKYDFESRLHNVISSTQSMEVAYDALSQRAAVSKNSITSIFTIDPFGFGNLIANFDGDGNRLAQFVYGLGLVSYADGGGGFFYYSFDAAGTISEITNSLSNVEYRSVFDPYGQNIYSTSSSLSQFGYLGELGVIADLPALHDMRARFYSPYLGRFLSVDPIGLEGGQNWYAYVGNDPVGRADPSGLGMRIRVKRFRINRLYGPTDVKGRIEVPSINIKDIGRIGPIQIDGRGTLRRDPFIFTADGDISFPFQFGDLTGQVSIRPSISIGPLEPDAGNSGIFPGGYDPTRPGYKPPSVPLIFD